METKVLLTGILSFMAGGLLVAIAANTFDKPQTHDSMTSMVTEIENKKGEAYDSAFIEQMVIHHEGAVEMAKLSNERAKHQEIKDLSRNIIKTQENEIAQMKQWQKDWRSATPSQHGGH